MTLGDALVQILTNKDFLSTFGGALTGIIVMIFMYLTLTTSTNSGQDTEDSEKKD